MYSKIINLDEKGKYRLYCRLEPERFGPSMGDTPAMLYVPGGGFMFCDPADQLPMLYKMMAYGYQTFTFTYPTQEEYRFPDIIIYLSKALKLIRDHAAEWHVDPHRIVAGGSSAGAHIVGTLGAIWNRDFIREPAGCSGTENKPDLMLLCYGPLYCNQQTDDGFIFVPSGDLVGPHTPPTYLAHCGDDRLVPVDQSLAYAVSLRKAGVSFSMFISGNGDHGGVQNNVPHITANHQLMVDIDDWFGSFLKFADNELGVSAIPTPMPVMDEPPESIPEDEVRGIPVLDENGIQMGSFAAGLKLCFDGGIKEPFENVLK